MDDGRLTIGQLFDYTPDGTDIIRSCVFRPDNWDLKAGNASVCNDRFKISRFVTQERMCYHIKDTSDFTYDHDSVSLSTYLPSVIYEITFNDKLKEANVVSVITFTGDLPYFSRVYSSPPVAFYDGKAKKTSDIISATPVDTRMHILERPYDTDCYDKSEEEMFRCEYECLIQHLSELGLMPAWLLIREDYLLPHLRLTTLFDAQNVTVKEHLDKSRNTCNGLCFSRTCELLLTRTYAAVSKIGDFSVAVRLMSPPDPETQVTAVHSMSFIDFFTFICSCFGTWFGISFLSLESYGRRKVTSSRTQCGRSYCLRYDLVREITKRHGLR